MEHCDRGYARQLKRHLVAYQDRARCDPIKSLLNIHGAMIDLACKYKMTEPQQGESYATVLARISRRSETPIYTLWTELLQERESIQHSNQAFFCVLQLFALSLPFQLVRHSPVIFNGVAEILRASVKRTYYGEIMMYIASEAAPDQERYLTTLSLIPGRSGLGIYFRRCHQLGLQFVPSGSAKGSTNCVYASVILGDLNVAYLSEFVGAVMQSDRKTISRILRKVGPYGVSAYFSQRCSWDNLQRLIWRAAAIGGSDRETRRILKGRFPLFEPEFHLEYLIANGEIDPVLRYLDLAYRKPVIADCIVRSAPWMVRRIWRFVAGGTIDSNYAMRLYRRYHLFEHPEWCIDLCHRGPTDHQCAGLFLEIYQYMHLGCMNGTTDISALRASQASKNADLFLFFYLRVSSLGPVDPNLFQGERGQWAADQISSYRSKIRACSQLGGRSSRVGSLVGK